MLHSKYFTLVLFLIFIAPFAAADIIIKDAWIREAPPISRVQAAYATFQNNLTNDLELISATSSAFEKIEFHQTTLKNGLSKMQQQTSIAVPAHNEVKLEPTGMHMMLFNPTMPIRAGNEIEIHFKFSNGFTTTENFIVKKVTGIGHHQHMHH